MVGNEEYETVNSPKGSYNHIIILLYWQSVVKLKNLLIVQSFSFDNNCQLMWVVSVIMKNVQNIKIIFV